MNLAANARDAMPDGGRLTIRTRNVTERDSMKHTSSGLVAGEYVLIEVEDTGTGMSAEVMSKIFEPFFTTKEIGKGTGLGLASVYGIVRQTGGHVIPESEVGKGTTFRVYLPRHIPAADEEPSKASKKDRARDLTGSGRVLLVEDEDGVRSFASRALKQQGYTVLEASSGVEALEVMKGQTVDIVVSDVLMPEMDGPTLMNELRKRTPDLKFIFVSGYADDALEKSLDAKAQFAFLPKPFTLLQLAAKVKEELRK
jgi:two-component system cell cycle sensor histidine kinase/response regulator CckA